VFSVNNKFVDNYYTIIFISANPDKRFSIYEGNKRQTDYRTKTHVRRNHSYQEK